MKSKPTRVGIASLMIVAVLAATIGSAASPAAASPAAAAKGPTANAKPEATPADGQAFAAFLHRYDGL